MTPTISIIVPVYNTEKYLSLCIESILSQSFGDFELLLVDDGSIDNSGKICDEYAERDSRIRVFHKENGGVGSARNLGLEEAKGEYVVLVDADDIIAEKYLEHLMAVDSDLVISGLQKFGASNDMEVPAEYISYDIIELPRHWNTPPKMNYLFCYACATRFRTSIINKNNIRFNESIFYSEDMCFKLLYMSMANTVTELPYADYRYRIENVSRDEKFNMSAEELAIHHNYLMECLQKLYDRIGQNTLTFVTDNTNRRLLRKFYYFLTHVNSSQVFVHNIKDFKKQEWAGYMLGLLEGKRERRVMKEAVRFPYLTYLIEVRIHSIVRKEN